MSMRTIKSINPFDGREIGTYTKQTDESVQAMLKNAHDVFPLWRSKPVEERAQIVAKAGKILRDNVDEYARMITLEMGKPITESRAEVNKCAWVCEYYAEHAAAFLAPETIATDATKSYVRHDPLGCVLAIMPWNFPFWQVFRFAAPALAAGNTGLLKHASNVYGCAEQIADVFAKAGAPVGVFQNLIIDHTQTEAIIAHDTVKAVTLTGSEAAGSAVAATAGKYLKKTVLELGGNNAFIVLKDADIGRSVKTALTARMLNCGQSCIAAKRFILVDSVYEEFVSLFTKGVAALKSGDPIDESTQVGPLARKDLADDLQRQVQESLKQGAELLAGGSQKGAYHEPTVLGNVTPGMPAFDEETFGPLAAMVKAKDEADAFRLSEMSAFGLGVTVCTQDTDNAESLAASVSDGAYFVNELVKSDPRLPFGGTKRSGYGRELARDGMMEFVNRKTVYVKA